MYVKRTNRICVNNLIFSLRPVLGACLVGFELEVILRGEVGPIGHLLAIDNHIVKDHVAGVLEHIGHGALFEFHIGEVDVAHLVALDTHGIETTLGRLVAHHVANLEVLKDCGVETTPCSVIVGLEADEGGLDEVAQDVVHPHVADKSASVKV